MFLARYIFSLLNIDIAMQSQLLAQIYSNLIHSIYNLDITYIDSVCFFFIHLAAADNNPTLPHQATASQTDSNQVFKAHLFTTVFRYHI